MTVIETARRAAGLSQRRLAQIARTQQSSVSEYESRRKSPTLEVVERLLDAADAELAVRPIIFWVFVDEDSKAGPRPVPDRLWSVPTPQCFARVQVLAFKPIAGGKDIWDLSDPNDRIEYYELVLSYGLDDMLVDTVDGVLLVQAWPQMNLPETIREAWQPAIDAGTGAASRDDPPRDPAGINARIAASRESR
jgi:transcriptional regulator with XRE-family HTH domain